MNLLFRNFQKFPHKKWTIFHSYSLFFSLPLIRMPRVSPFLPQSPLSAPRNVLSLLLSPMVSREDLLVRLWPDSSRRDSSSSAARRSWPPRSSSASTTLSSPPSPSSTVLLSTWALVPSLLWSGKVITSSPAAERCSAPPSPPSLLPVPSVVTSVFRSVGISFRFSVSIL